MYINNHWQKSISIAHQNAQKFSAHTAFLGLTICLPDSRSVMGGLHWIL